MKIALVAAIVLIGLALADAQGNCDPVAAASCAADSVSTKQFILIF